jgi:hypothetical protein
MPNIKFDYGGQTFEATVVDAFLNLDEAEQARRLEGKLQAVDVTKGTAGGKGFLHALSLIERPAQALKVGLKESAIGGELYRALGGVDTTPKEGLLTGMKRGWLGEEAVRTQDFLPEHLPGWYKGLLGFTGDVLTDPVTFSGGLIGKSIYGLGRGIKAATPRPVADALQGLKQKDVVQDFARAINVPLGDSKIVKNVGQLSNKHRAAIDRELAEELPKVKQWLESTGKFRGQTSEDMNQAFRTWMDRPKVIPITKKMRESETPESLARIEAHNAKATKNQDALRQSVEDVLGKDGIDYVDSWAKKLDNLLQTERAAGLFTQALIARHYFPRFVTPHGRESLAEAGEEFFPSGIPAEVDDPLFFFSREPFRNPRIHWEGLDEVNLEKWNKTGGTSRNPADIPYEDRFFHTDVPVALGLRWVDHAAARQKRWFLDTVTDSGKFPEGLAGQGRPHMEVGRWVRKDLDNPDKFQERFFSWDKKTGEYVDDWRAMSDDTKDWVDVRGVPRKYADEEAIRLKANTAAEAEMAIALTKGIPIKDAMKLSDAARKKVWADSDRISEVFKAPKQVAKQIEQELQLMGAMSPSDDALKTFFKFWDEIQNPWKAWTLAIRPAYHTRNAIGNIYNAYIVTGLGSNIPKAVETFGNAAKLQYYARFEGSNLMRNQAAQRLRDHDKNIRGAGVEKMPEINDADWVSPDFADTGYTMKEISEEGLNRGINAGHYRKDIVRDDIAELEYMQGRGLHQKRARLIGQQNPAIKIGFAVGGTIEGNARYAIFLDTLAKIRRGDDFDWIAPDGKKVKLSQFGDEGNEYWTTDMRYNDRGELIQDRRLMTRDDASFDIAANKVKEALFDYSDLSLFERNIMKRVMPFYTWSRKNFPVQIKHLALNPQRAEKLHLAKEQFEYDSGDLDYSDYGAFWGKRVPVFLGKEDKGVIKAFTLLNTIPLVELQRFYNPKSLILEMTSPFPKEIFEQLANYDTFREKPVVEFPEAGILGESKDLLGVALPARLWKLSQLLVPLIEVNRLNPAGVFGKQTVDPATGDQRTTRGWFGWGAYRESNPIDISEGARWVRFFSGARVYDINLEKQRYFANKNLTSDLRQLKGKLKWALGKGENRRASQLMELIDEIQRQELIDPR